MKTDRTTEGWLGAKATSARAPLTWSHLEPGTVGRIDTERAHDNRGERVTAAFLEYLTDK